MTNYSDLQRRNAANTSALAVRVLRGTSGTSAASAAAPVPAMPLPTFLSGIVVAGAFRAVLLADLGLAAWLMKRTGRPAPTVGLALPKDTGDAITEGVQTITEESGDDLDELSTRAERLANAAPLSAGQDAYQQAAEAHGLEAWIRKTDPTPCALCKSLADGKARPYSVRMFRHPGCECVAEPVEIGPDFRGKLITGHGIGGVETTFARPGLTFTRSTFVPARSA